MADLVDDPALRAEVQAAIDDANKAVSSAEAIKKFVILPEDWTEAGGQITPSLKLKRNVVADQYAAEIAALFNRLTRLHQASPQASRKVSRQPRGRSSHCHSRLTQARPAAPIAFAGFGIGQQPDESSPIAPRPLRRRRSRSHRPEPRPARPPELPATTGSPLADASR